MGSVHDTSEARSHTERPLWGCPKGERARFAEWRDNNVKLLVTFGIEPFWHTPEQQLAMRRALRQLPPLERIAPPPAFPPAAVGPRTASPPADTVDDGVEVLRKMRDRLTAEAGHTMKLWTTWRMGNGDPLSPVRWRIIAEVARHPSRPKQADVGLAIGCTQSAVSEAVRRMMGEAVK
ncbi:MAG: hypothetical protein ACREJO_03555 [Phycisphaerales bacterium]